MRRIARMAALLVVAGAAFTVRAETAEMPDPGTFIPGETWEWRQVDSRTKVEDGKRTRTVVNEDGVLKFSDGTTSTPISTALVGDSPEKPFRAWPLAVGSKWIFDADWARPDGVTGNTKQNAEVVGYEEVSVPAGKFMAFRIEYRGWYRNSRGRSGKQNDTYWYAPDVKADVKHVRDDGYNMYTRELIGYKRSD